MHVSIFITIQLLKGKNLDMLCHAEQMMACGFLGVCVIFNCAIRSYYLDQSSRLDVGVNIGLNAKSTRGAAPGCTLAAVGSTQTLVRSCVGARAYSRRALVLFCEHVMK